MIVDKAIAAKVSLTEQETTLLKALAYFTHASALAEHSGLSTKVCVEFLKDMYFGLDEIQP